jgi:uncharacterized protein (TIGR03118 family)
MKIRSSISTAGLAVTALLFTTSFTFAAVHAERHRHRNNNHNIFDWDNLQSDIAGVAEQKDPNVVNPWGITISPFSGNVWVADNGTGVATVYFQDGTPFPNPNNPLVVSIPASATNTEGANPTGIVSNTTPFFQVSNGTNSLPAQFIFVSEDGLISGWNQQLSSTQAFPAVDNGANDAIYKGATRGFANGHNFLYVTNFHAGVVETYDENFVLQSGFPFADPNLPAGFAPFGIRRFDGEIFVTYALQDADKEDDVPGPGNGFIDVFDTSGQFLRRLVSSDRLNSPWGLEIVNGALWVGNFGDGRINVYNPNNGDFVGRPRDGFGNPLEFDGLWGFTLGSDRLFFAAGIADEEHGLVGAIF